MIYSIVLQDDVFSHVDDKTNIYSPNSKYFTCLITEDNIPLSIKEQLIPVIIDTGFEIPVKVFQHYYKDTQSMIDPELNRKLMSFRSRMTYSISENLSQTGYYVKLEIPMNNVETRRNYIYKLYYQEMPCFILKSDTLLNDLIAAKDQNLGPMLISTYSLNVEKVPHWYTKEMFRDIIELGEYSIQDKILIEGPRSKELYLFYKEEFNITEDMFDDLISDIRGNINASMKLKMFPRNTPEEYIRNKELTRLNNGQYTINYEVPEDINIFQETYKLAFDFKNFDELYWFLVLAQNLNGLHIKINSNLINVTYETNYLPDLIKVNSAKRVHTNENKVKLSYDNPNGIKFYDDENNEVAILSLH